MSSGFRLRLLIEGTDAAAQEAEEIGLRAIDARPMLRVVKKLMERAGMEQFATEGARSGEHWVPDRPGTVARKAAAGEDTRTEYRTGSLARSIIGDGNTIRRLSAHSTTFGTRVFYARFQGHKRRLLRLTLHDADRYAQILVEWLLQGKGDMS